MKQENFILSSDICVGKIKPVWRICQRTNALYVSMKTLYKTIFYIYINILIYMQKNFA